MAIERVTINLATEKTKNLLILEDYSGFCRTVLLGLPANREDYLNIYQEWKELESRGSRIMRHQVRMMRPQRARSRSAEKNRRKLTGTLHRPLSVETSPPPRSRGF